MLITCISLIVYIQKDEFCSFGVKKTEALEGTFGKGIIITR